MLSCQSRKATAGHEVPVHDPVDAIDRGELRDALVVALARDSGALGRRDLLSTITATLQAEDESCRFWAAWAAALLGDFSSANVLRE